MKVILRQRSTKLYIIRNGEEEKRKKTTEKA